MLFISHSSADRVLAGEIKKMLDDAYYSAFLAHEDIQGGNDWHDDIWSSLTTCTAFVGVVTAKFNSSAYCQQEVGAALALNKPRVLVKTDASDPPGFQSRFQAVRRVRLVELLDTKPMFRTARVQAWIEGAPKVLSYAAANSLHDRFSSEWEHMGDDERFKWLLAAAANSQVTTEGYRAGPFFRQQRKKLRPKMSDQWLFDNDKGGVLHTPEDNPVAKQPRRTARQRRSN